MRRAGAIVGLSLFFALLVGSASPVRADVREDFAIGFNQGWLPRGWGFVHSFDEREWRRLFRLARASGGSVVRVWVFMEAQWDGVSVVLGQPIASPEVTADIVRLSRVAREERVRIYWMLLEGNNAAHYRAIATNENGLGDQFRDRVVGKVADALRENADVVFGLDVVNEIEGAVASGVWSDGWTGARKFLAATVAAVHARAGRAVRVSASAGWASAQDDILSGRFDGLGLDFYDVHVYTDATRIPQGRALADYAAWQGLPIVLGEFGQSSKDVRPELQARVTLGLVRDAWRLGFSAALAWRLCDQETRFSFYDGGGYTLARPAVAEVQAFARWLERLRALREERAKR